MLTWDKAFKIALEYLSTMGIMLAVVLCGIAVTGKQRQAELKLQQETPMKEHTKLLQPYRQRIEGIFADMEGTLNTIDDNADTPDAIAGNGYTVGENLAVQLAGYRKAFDSVLNDMAVGVIDYAKRARIDAD